MEIMFQVGAFGVVAGAIVLFSAFKVLREYERAVVFRLGRYVGVRGPGLVLLIPGLERMVRVSMRVITLELPPAAMSPLARRSSRKLHPGSRWRKPTVVNMVPEARGSPMEKRSFQAGSARSAMRRGADPSGTRSALRAITIRLMREVAQ